MKIEVFCEDLAGLKAGAVVIFNEKGKVAIRGLANEINRAIDGKISDLIESEEFDSAQDSFDYFFTFDKYHIPRIGLAGYDMKEEATLNPIRSAAARAVKTLRAKKIKKVALIVPTVKGWEMPDVSRAVMEGALLGLYRFEKYLSESNKKKLSSLILVGEGKDKRTLEKAVLLGEMESSGVRLARDVGNEPSNVLTPVNFANIVRKMMNKVNVNCDVLDHNDIKKEGLGLLQGVAQGSDEPPRMAVMSYKAGKKYPTVGLVGKGITFDSGGIVIKPDYSGLFDMKRDMAGAAAVLGVMYIVGQLRPKINVVAALPMAENMPSGKSFKPGDILISYSGKSVEIFHTDAEGRLIMADAMSYLQEKYPVDYLVDVATLTGAVVRTAGPSLVGLFGNDSRLLERIRKSGVQAGEETMDFPLYPGYKKRVKSHFADVKNLSYKGPSAITSGLFLEQFVNEGVKWAHLDIASIGTQTGEGTYRTRGATGGGVLLLTNLLLGMAK